MTYPNFLSLNKNTILTQQSSTNWIPIQFQVPSYRYLFSTSHQQLCPASSQESGLWKLLEDKSHNNKWKNDTPFPVFPRVWISSPGLFPSPEAAHPKPSREGGYRRVSVSLVCLQHLSSCQSKAQSPWVLLWGELTPSQPEPTQVEMYFPFWNIRSGSVLSVWSKKLH